MNDLVAKPIMKNKYWIVESDGSKVATIQAVDNGGFVYVSNGDRERFNTIKLLTKVHNVEFSKEKVKSDTTYTNRYIYEFPVTGRAYNIMWDLKHKFPVFTKSKKSKSYFCAGHYIIKLNDEWTQSFCPKFITLNRYEFFGPYKTAEEATARLLKLTNDGK